MSPVVEADDDLVELLQTFLAVSPRLVNRDRFLAATRLADGIGPAVLTEATHLLEGAFEVDTHYSGAKEPWARNLQAGP